MDIQHSVYWSVKDIHACLKIIAVMKDFRLKMYFKYLKVPPLKLILHRIPLDKPCPIETISLYCYNY